MPNAAGLLKKTARSAFVARAVAASVGMLLWLSLGFGNPVWAAATDWIGDNHAKARLITAVEATGSGRHVDAGLEIKMAPGWHAYWRTPGDAGVPPVIDWKGSSNLAGATIAWPAPTRLITGELETYVYPDYVLLPISVSLAEPGQPLTLHASTDYAACAAICVPYHADFTLVLASGLARPGPEAPLLAAAWNRVPRSLDDAGISLLSATVSPARRGGAVLSVRLMSTEAGFHAPDLFIEGLKAGIAGKPLVTLSDRGRTASFQSPVAGIAIGELGAGPLTFTLADGPTHAAEFAATPTVVAAATGGPSSIATILGVALLGGLILNLMPCVLPVLSLKLLSIAGLAGSERRHVRASLLSTAAGVLASFLVLAVALIVLKSAGAAIGWGIQFQQPLFLAAMATVTTLFAASLWGWLPIGLPAKAQTIAGWHARRPLIDAFVTGMFATLLAASCSAPFVGTAVGFALARGWREIVTIFGALGLGLAAPYLFMAALPAMVRWLPRPGRWMVRLRQVLGFALAGTAIWLLVVLADVASLAAAVVATGLLAVLLAVLALRGWLALAGRPGMALRIGAAAIAALSMISPTVAERLAPSPGSAIPEHRAHSYWQAFDSAAIPRLVAEGKLVFVDVSAAWCLTCKANELAVLDRSPVIDRLRAPDVIAMRADWTRPDQAVTEYLQSFGRYGVPLDVVYGPRRPNGEALPELLSASAVILAFEHAADNSKAGVVAASRSTAPRRSE